MERQHTDTALSRPPQPSHQSRSRGQLPAPAQATDGTLLPHAPQCRIWRHATRVSFFRRRSGNGRKSRVNRTLPRVLPGPSPTQGPARCPGAGSASPDSQPGSASPDSQPGSAPLCSLRLPNRREGSPTPGVCTITVFPPPQTGTRMPPAQQCTGFEIDSRSVVIPGCPPRNSAQGAADAGTPPRAHSNTIRVATREAQEAPRGQPL